MDTVERLRAWSYHRQGLAAPADHPQQALGRVVAVYAAHPTAPLALWARTRDLVADAYRALDREGEALRIPGMRGTVFLAPRQTAGRIFTALRPPASRVARTLKRTDLTSAAYERVAAKILAAAEGPTPRKELEEAAGLSGGPLTAVLACLRYEGRLLALAGDSLSTGAHRFVAAGSLIPDGLDAGDPEESLAWLAGEYLRAYGPARIEDFRWWTGAGKRAAAAAVAANETVDVGDGLLLLPEDEADFAKIRRPRGTVDLLPKWDPYTMGHAPDGRQRFVHPDVQERVYTPMGVGLPGDGNPVVAVDGEAVATWTYTKKDGPDVQPFDGLTPAVRRKVEDRLGDVEAFLVGRER